MTMLRQADLSGIRSLRDSRAVREWVAARQSVRYPIPGTVQTNERQTRMAKPRYTEFRISQFEQMNPRLRATGQ